MTLGTAMNLRERAILEEVQEALRAEVDGAVEAAAPAERVRGLIGECIAEADRRAAALGEDPLRDVEGATRRILDELTGFGPLQQLLDAPDVEEVLLNGPTRVFAIMRGRKELTDVVFEDDAAVLALLRRTLGPLGRRIDETSPLVDARLADGSRLHAVIPPLTSRWTHVTIRKFVLRAHTLDDLVALDTLTPDAAAFLAAAVRGGLNILIAGATGAGKTTCLNALGSCISAPDERVVTIEETAELRLEQTLPDCVALQARPPNVEGVGAVSIRTLVRNALRMRPSRIVVGEVRGAEALDMLTAMSSGHSGSMCTLHAGHPRQALAKLRTYALMAEEALPAGAVTEMIADAVDLVVQLQLDAESGRRVVSSIYEVTGQEGETVVGSELFTREGGDLRWCGIRSRRERRLLDAGWTGPPGDAGAGRWREESRSPGSDVWAGARAGTR